MALANCPTHGPYVADTSTDFGERWCPECGPHPSPLAEQEAEARKMLTRLRIASENPLVYVAVRRSDVEAVLAALSKAEQERDKAWQASDFEMRRAETAEARERDLYGQLGRLEIDVRELREALERIANLDYRGNRSTESDIAYRALQATQSPPSENL